MPQYQYPWGRRPVPEITTFADLPSGLPVGTLAYTSDDGLCVYQPSGWLAIGSGGAGGGAGAEIAYTSPTGTIDPNLSGFVAGLGSAGTGRIRITITANTSWQGLPAGVDGQTLVLIVVSGAFTFELLALDSSTALHQIMASANSSYEEYDAAQLVYSSSLSNWVLIL